MRSVLLCEGNDDLWFLAYYLHKVGGWDTTKGEDAWGTSKIPCRNKKQTVLYMVKAEEQILAIKSVAGQNNLSDSVRDILHWNNSNLGNPIDNLIVFRDCDDRNEATLLEEMKTWFPVQLPLRNNRIADYMMNEEFDIELHILPLVVPFTEPGAIETLLSEAIAEHDTEGQYISTHASEYIEEARENLSTYLTKAREVTKAKYAAIMAVYDPTHSRDTFEQLMMSTPWEESASIRHHMSTAIEMLDGIEALGV